MARELPTGLSNAEYFNPTYSILNRYRQEAGDIFQLIIVGPASSKMLLKEYQ
ncbi:MAG: hypothetical protein ABSF09_11220 [Candidatus Bathyarchaeia archaeon]